MVCVVYYMWLRHLVNSCIIIWSTHSCNNMVYMTTYQKAETIKKKLWLMLFTYIIFCKIYYNIICILSCSICFQFMLLLLNYAFIIVLLSINNNILISISQLNIHEIINIATRMFYNNVCDLSM